MKKNYAKRFAAVLSAMLIISSASFPQFNNTDFLRAGTVDGALLAKAYITPWANAFGAALNGSWYNTAKPHKLGGFDLTLGANFGFVPSSATTFDVSKIGLTEFTGSGMAPTVAGKGEDGPTLTGPSAGWDNSVIVPDPCRCRLENYAGASADGRDRAASRH